MTTEMVTASHGGDIFTPGGFNTSLKIAEALVKSGILPRGIDTPFKAFAIIQKGREIGVGPMRALTGIHLIEGKLVVSPELKMEQFRERGGHCKWLRSDATVAELWLKAPNGDEHTETVTLEEMKLAGVAAKDNWKRYPKSMLRARCAGFGLRALGEGDGSYTPDEVGIVTDESGGVAYEPPANDNGRAPKAQTAGGTVYDPTTGVVEDFPTQQPGISPPGTAGEPPAPSSGAKPSLRQTRRYHALRDQLGLDEDAGKARVVEYLRRPIESISNDLTAAELSRVIDAMEKRAAHAGV